MLYHQCFLTYISRRSEFQNILAEKQISLSIVHDLLIIHFESNLRMKPRKAIELREE